MKLIKLMINKILSVIGTILVVFGILLMILNVLSLIIPLKNNDIYQQKNGYINGMLFDKEAVEQVIKYGSEDQNILLKN